ncbi:hypothetical protein AOLI_G00184650 [Acnodon oligacanthus]
MWTRALTPPRQDCKNFFCHFSLPTLLHNDHRQNFQSQVMADVIRGSQEDTSHTSPSRAKGTRGAGARRHTLPWPDTVGSGRTSRGGESGLRWYIITPPWHRQDGLVHGPDSCPVLRSSYAGCRPKSQLCCLAVDIEVLCRLGAGSFTGVQKFPLVPAACSESV